MPIYSEEYAQDTRGYLHSFRDDGNIERREGEFNFFSTYAKEAGGQVLELACGAGRVMMEMAKRGFTVFGIEASPHMLKIGIDAVSNLPLRIQRRIHFIQGDMTQFAFKKKFKLIIIPFHSFWFNLDEQGAKECLSCIMDNLKPNGVFIIDNPFGYCNRQTWWAEMAKKYGFDFEWKDYDPKFNPEYSYYQIIVGRKIS